MTTVAMETVSGPDPARQSTTARASRKFFPVNEKNINRDGREVGPPSSLQSHSNQPKCHRWGHLHIPLQTISLDSSLYCESDLTKQ